MSRQSLWQNSSVMRIKLIGLNFSAKRSKSFHIAAGAAKNQLKHPQVISDFSRNSQSTPISTTMDPYLYTSGRWLNHDKLNREARHVKFDFMALCAKAIKVCAGATKVVHCEKKEGGFNRAFLLSLDNGAQVVAKVPYGIAGPRRLTTNSEVATMAYVRSSTKIPVPRVLDWSDDQTSVGSEYIIMERAPGIALQEKWPSMSPHQHVLCVKNVTFTMTEMAKLPFPIYGSLYFADAPIDPNLKISFIDDFCIGPHCGGRYWDCTVGEARFYDERSPNRGPWLDLQSYCSGLIDAGFSCIPKLDDPHVVLSYRGSVQEHLRLLDISKKSLQKVAQSSILLNVASPTLLHPDVHKRNIYVSEKDPSCVTAMIDWQSSSIEPAFVYASDTPDLVDDSTADIQILENLMSLESEPSTTMSDKETPSKSLEDDAARKRYEEDLLRCRKTFDVILLGYMRKLHDARTMDQTLLRPFQYCDVSWINGAAALRQELIELSRCWDTLGLPSPCSYQPTPEELTEHTKQYEDFETVQQLKLFLRRALDTDADGWVPYENWDTAREENTRLFKQWLEQVKKLGGTEDRARALWPFNEIGSLQE